MKRTKISRRSTGNQLEQARAHEQVSGMGPATDFPVLLTSAEVAAKLRVHQRTLMRLVADCKARFPAPIRLGRSVRWREADLLGWLGGER